MDVNKHAEKKTDVCPNTLRESALVGDGYKKEVYHHHGVSENQNLIIVVDDEVIVFLRCSNTHDNNRIEETDDSRIVDIPSEPHPVFIQFLVRIWIPHGQQLRRKIHIVRFAVDKV